MQPLLDENQLSGGIPKDLGQLQALEMLYLDTNQLSGGIPKELGQLRALQELWSSNNQLIVPKLHSGEMNFNAAEETTQKFLECLRQ